MLSREEKVISIPGMKRRVHLDGNVSAVDIALTLEELARLDAAFPVNVAVNARYNPEQSRWLGP